MQNYEKAQPDSTEQDEHPAVGKTSYCVNFHRKMPLSKRRDVLEHCFERQVTSDTSGIFRAFDRQKKLSCSVMRSDFNMIGAFHFILAKPKKVLNVEDDHILRHSILGFRLQTSTEFEGTNCHMPSILEPINHQIGYSDGSRKGRNIVMEKLIS